MQPRTYLNFDMSIRLDESGGIQVAVLASPAGEAHELHDWPFSDQDLEIFLLRVGHTRRGVRRIDSPEMEAARGFGEELYEAIFSGQIGTSFERSIDEAERRGQGLRLRLRTDDTPELSDVPWEFLYSTPLHRFLTVSTATPLVRYIEQPRVIPALAVEEAVRILTMVSSPTDVADLDVENEWARINESLKDLASSGLIDLRRLPEATMGALQRELRQREYHVFHFIGHGGFDAGNDEGVLMFEDDRRRGRQVSGEHLGTILHDHESLRLVVLNSCEGARSSPRDPFGGTAQGLVRQGIPAVIGMQFEITDGAAITFSHDFYSAIADGYPVDAALAEARKAIFTSGNDVEWGTPVLHMRTPDGRIFDTAKRVAPPQPEGTDELSDRFEEVKRAALASNLEAAVALLESIVDDYPRSAAAADKLAATQRSLRADRLYASARVLFQAEQWQAVADRFLEIKALDPDFPDSENLRPAAEEALAQQKRDARLDALHREAETAGAARNWSEAVRLLGRISAEDAEYRDVSELLEEAKTWRDAGALLAAAREAFHAEDWHAVVSRFDELRLLGPDYSEDPDGLESTARVRLGEEQQRRRLRAEYDAATALVDMEKWKDAIRILDKIGAEQPDYLGIDKLRDTIREQARKQEVDENQQRAAALYAAAAADAAQEQWNNVIDTLDQVEALVPDYRGAEVLRERAQKAQLVEKQRADRLEGRYRGAAEAYEAGEWERSIGLLEAITAESPHDENAAQLLTQAQAHLQSGTLPPGPTIESPASPRVPRLTARVVIVGAIAAIVLVALTIWLLTARSDRLRQVFEAAFVDRMWIAEFSPDGTQILTAGDGTTAHLWDLDGTALATLEGHTDWFRSGVFSPDGTQILTTSDDTTARLWDLDGTALATLIGHGNLVASGVFSLDGTQILTASGDTTARLWNLDGTILTTFEGHTEGVESGVFGPDGAQILTASHDGTARLWDLDGTTLATFEGHTDPVLSGVFSPDGTRVLTVSDDTTARLWDLNGTTVAILEGHTEGLVSGVFSPDGTQILTASFDGTARLWDLDGTTVAILEDHTDSVRSAVFSPDGTEILTASFDGTARLWDLDGTTLATLEGHTGGVESAVFSPDGTLIVTASLDHTARLWDARTS